MDSKLYLRVPRRKSCQHLKQTVTISKFKANILKLKQNIISKTHVIISLVTVSSLFCAKKNQFYGKQLHWRLISCEIHWRTLIPSQPILSKFGMTVSSPADHRQVLLVAGYRYRRCCGRLASGCERSMIVSESLVTVCNSLYSC